MAKDINIHLKVKDSEEARRLLDGFSQDVQKIGGSVEQLGSKASAASGPLSSFADKLTGLLEMVGLAAATMKVIRFFDTIKARSNEAVRDLEGVRKGFEGIFDAMGAYDEESRKKIVAESAGLMKETGTPAETAKPIIAAYARAYKGDVDSGKISQQQYDKDLKTMLSWGALHPGTAAPELIKMLPGWNVSADVATRMVSATAGKSRLEEVEVTEALSRSQSTAQMMGWSLEKTLETIGNVGTREEGRMRTSMPMQAIEALGRPTIPDAEKLGELFGEKNKHKQERMKKSLESQKPEDIAEGIRGYTANMPPEQRNKFLTAFYGAADKAVLKSWTAGPEMGVAIEQAAGPAGAAAAEEQRAKWMGTDVAQNAQTAADVQMIQEKLTADEKTMENVYKRGEAQQKIKQIQGSLLEKAADEIISRIAPEYSKERAAKLAWIESLSQEEKEAIANNPQVGHEGIGDVGGLNWTWKQMSPKQKEQSSSGVTIINDNSIRYYPAVGDNIVGPRSDPNDIR